MSLPGSAPLGGLLGPRSNQQGGGSTATPFGQMSEQQVVQYMQAVMESCPAKTVLSGGMGFALGGMFGLFMASMRYDTPISTPNTSAATIQNLPWRQQLSHGLKDMGRASYSSARNFGMIGALFSGIECTIEGFRARNDISNGAAAGCLTGGVLAAKAGPQACAIGCAGFAAFSTAIEYYMRMPGEGTGGPIE